MLCVYYKGTVQRSVGPSSLVADPSFRCSVALVHADRLAGLELHWSDGRCCWVSHEGSLRPVMSPCHLRLALAQAAVGTGPDWLHQVDGWTVGGPFVEPLGHGVLAGGDARERTCTFATTLAPMVVQQLGAAVDVRGSGRDDLDVAVSMDPAVSASCVRVLGRPGAVDDGAVALARACRAHERRLRSARDHVAS